MISNDSIFVRRIHAHTGREYNGAYDVVENIVNRWVETKGNSFFRMMDLLMLVGDPKDGFLGVSSTL